MILKEIDKLIEKEKVKKSSSIGGVLHWEYNGAIRAYEDCKKLLKDSAITRLAAKKSFEPHICYTDDEKCWVVSFGKHPSVGAGKTLGEAINAAIDQFEAKESNQIN